MQEKSAIESNNPAPGKWSNVRVALLLFASLLVFLFAINLMVASLHKLSEGLSESILLATSNPFKGLFIGLLITALLQSSSTTTALVVAFVASRSITLEAAIPIIMGANIGTTITSTIVSLGFINKKKEFRRAVAAGTYHDVFNILVVLLLFPLEYYYRILTNLSSFVADFFFVPVLNPVQNVTTSPSFLFHPVINLLYRIFPSGLVLTLISVAILFGSILLFRKIVTNLLNVKQPQGLSRFVFNNPFKSFSWGVVTTAAIRSSTITTSLVVPVVAKKLASLKQAAPFIIGANIGTTITAFIAVSLNPTTREAIIIASAHLLFNLIGVLLFLVTPVLKTIPLRIATRLGRLTLRYRMVGFVYLLSMFFFVPFVLIYFNQDAVQNYRLVYEQPSSGQAQYYQLYIRQNAQTGKGEWIRYEGRENAYNAVPASIRAVTFRDRTFFIGNQMILFNRPGFCWDGEANGAEVKTCVEEILPSFSVNGISFDSVYVFRQQSRSALDTVSHWFYYSAQGRMLLLHEVDSGSARITVEKLISLESN